MNNPRISNIILKLHEDSNNTISYSIIDRMRGMVSDFNMGRFETIFKRFSDMPFDEMKFCSVKGADRLIEPSLSIYFLKSGLSTDDENKGVVVVLRLDNRIIHLLDTEIYDNGYYLNTILMNMSELELMSDEVWSCIVRFKNTVKDWRYGNER